MHSFDRRSFEIDRGPSKGSRGGADLGELRKPQFDLHCLPSINHGLPRPLYFPRRVGTAQFTNPWSVSGGSRTFKTWVTLLPRASTCHLKPNMSPFAMVSSNLSQRHSDCTPSRKLNPMVHLALPPPAITQFWTRGGILINIGVDRVE